MSHTPRPDAAHADTMASSQNLSTNQEDSPSSSSSGSGASERLAQGQIVADRYRIERMVGEGGMGAVYKATHVIMGNPVALKVLHGTLSKDPEIMARFHREAQAASAIQHPNLCGATDFGKLPDGSFYMVMEYLKGKTLEEELKACVRLSLERTAHIVQQVLSVLQEAHALGIVHRDLKPENIMLVERAGKQDVVKIMDFGIASMREAEGQGSDTRLTRAGIAYGTPAYMSPEQVAGQTDIDGRADLYTLGAMMFEMLTGTTPFQGHNVAAMMAQHLTEPPPSARARAPDAAIPPKLDALLTRLLAKTPAERPSTAEELARDLHQITSPSTSTAAIAVDFPSAASISQSLIRVSSPLITAMSERPERMKPLLLIGAFGVVIMMGIGVIVALLATGPTEEERAVKQEAKQEAALIQEVKQTSRTLGEERDDFVSNTDGMRILLEKMAAGDHEQALRTLEERESKFADNAHYVYYMGVAHSAANHDKKATEAYLKAVALDERYQSDVRLLEHLASVASTPKSEARAAVIARIKEDESLRERLKPALIELATDPEAPNKKQKRALDTLKELGLFDTLQPWRQGVLELENGSGCKARTAAVKKIEEAGDARALPVLERWSQKPRKGCGFLKSKDCYGCIRDDLKRAIGALSPQEAPAE